MERAKKDIFHSPILTVIRVIRRSFFKALWADTGLGILQEEGAVEVRTKLRQAIRS